MTGAHSLSTAGRPEFRKGPEQGGEARPSGSQGGGQPSSHWAAQETEAWSREELGQGTSETYTSPPKGYPGAEQGDGSEFSLEMRDSAAADGGSASARLPGARRQPNRPNLLH